MKYLNEDEKQFDEEFDNLVPVNQEERDRVNTIIEKERKKRAISLRISESDLEQLKTRAFEEGVPYQTLITSVLRKYLSDQLVDRREVQKTFSMAREAGIKFG